MTSSPLIQITGGQDLKLAVVRSKTEALVCLRLLLCVSAYYKFNDGARVGEETVLQYFRRLCVDVLEL